MQQITALLDTVSLAWIGVLGWLDGVCFPKLGVVAYVAQLSHGNCAVRQCSRRAAEIGGELRGLLSRDSTGQVRIEGVTVSENGFFQQVVVAWFLQPTGRCSDVTRAMMFIVGGVFASSTGYSWLLNWQYMETSTAMCVGYVAQYPVGVVSRAVSVRGGEHVMCGTGKINRK